MSTLITPDTLRARERRMSGSIILGVPIVLVIITFLFWYQTWFGRRLTNAELIQYMQDTSVPHKTQHALTQVATEILRHDSAVKEVYPQVIAVAENKEPGLRSMAAWVMGQDNTSVQFHQALAKLVTDPDSMVRWNAALALARFGDAAGAAQLRSMLHPFNIQTTADGIITLKVDASDSVKAGEVVAKVKLQNSEEVDIRSPLAGVVEKRLASDGATVVSGNAILTIAPDDQQVWEALRGLYLVGQPNDLADVDALARATAGVSQRVREQAALTADAIRKRTNNSQVLGGSELQNQISKRKSDAAKRKRLEKQTSPP